MEFLRAREECGAVEAGHALVAEEQRDGLAPLAQFAQGLQGLLAGGGAQDAVVGGVTAAQVPRDGAQHLGVVVDDEDGGLGGR